MQPFTELVKIAIAVVGQEKSEQGQNSRQEIKLGNVRFWIDNSGPWIETLSYDLPLSQWEPLAINKDLCPILEACLPLETSTQGLPHYHKA